VTDPHLNPTDPHLDPRFLAGVKLLERTGAKTFRIGYSDEDDGPPTVWYAVATWRGRVAGGYPVRDTERAEAAAALDGTTAVMRLCEAVIDGGVCTHCQQPTIFDPDPPDDDPLSDLLDRMGCRYAWDPELSTFRRSCEGDAP
jgi:hypothetical protein